VALDEAEVGAALDEYYRLAGWDAATGNPPRDAGPPRARLGGVGGTQTRRAACGAAYRRRRHVMAYGTNGTILRVDLTRVPARLDVRRGFYRRYPGGKALAAYHLLRELRPGTDPLGPENVLVLATGLLTGAPVSTATRFNAIARSPLTAGFGESEAGGFWGPELKMAGLDAIVLEGRSPEPVYLWVKDGHVEIRDARHIWARTADGAGRHPRGAGRPPRPGAPDRPCGGEPGPLRHDHE